MHRQDRRVLHSLRRLCVALPLLTQLHHATLHGPSSSRALLPVSLHELSSRAFSEFSCRALILDFPSDHSSLVTVAFPLLQARGETTETSSLENQPNSLGDDRAKRETIVSSPCRRERPGILRNGSRVRGVVFAGFCVLILTSYPRVLNPGNAMVGSLPRF